MASTTDPTSNIVDTSKVCKHFTAVPGVGVTQGTASAEPWNCPWCEIDRLQATMGAIRAKLAEYLELLLQKRTLPNRWVGEINEIVSEALSDVRQHETSGELERLRRLQEAALALDDAVAEFGIDKPQYISEAYQAFHDELHDGHGADMRPTGTHDRIQTALGCFEAALVEGWLDALAEGDIERIRDLWTRRIAFAKQALTGDYSPVETSPPHPGPSIEKAFARSPRRVGTSGPWKHSLAAYSAGCQCEDCQKRRAAEKASEPQPQVPASMCVWRSGCRNPEKCLAAGCCQRIEECNR